VRDPSALRIVCPFVKQNALRWVAEGGLNSDARLITRFDLKGFAAGVSDVSALMDVLEAGGEVRGVRGLHAKVFIFADAVAAVTSANLTRRGLEHNTEFGCVSELPAFVGVCRAYFNDLWRRCGPSVTYGQLEQWQEQVNRFLASGARPETRDALPDHGMYAGQSLSDPIPAAEEGLDALGNGTLRWIAEAEHGHIKIFGGDTNRVKSSFPALEEVGSLRLALGVHLSARERAPSERPRWRRYVHGSDG
jgi:hypothetical protein